MFTREERLDFLVDDFNRLKKKGLTDQAAAGLILADAISGSEITLGAADSLGHEICMGIRWGLFGSGSTSNSIESLTGALGEIAGSIVESKNA